MRYEAIDSTLFINNRSRLSELLKPNSIVILHSNDVMPTNADGTMPFRQNADLLHLSGIDQEESILVLFPDAITGAQKEILFVLETNEHLAIWEGEKLTKLRATEVSGIQNVQWTNDFEATIHRLIQQAENVYLHSNEHLRAETSVETRNARYIKRFKENYPLHKIERLAPLMNQLRPVKHQIEVDTMQKACDITNAGFRRILEFVKPGVGEWEIEAEYIHEFVRRGSKGFAYTPIVGGGANANVLHYIENNQRVQDGDLILMDVGAEYANYNSDMTRTIPANGKFSERQRAVYDAVLRTLRKANELLRPGILPSDYQQEVILFMSGELLELGLITKEDTATKESTTAAVRKYFMHGTSHHIGLDVHDVNTPNMPIAVGHVYTIEPGIYIREENIGIRLENNFYIGETKNIDLMKNIPIEADEIEALMQK